MKAVDAFADNPCSFDTFPSICIGSKDFKPGTKAARAGAFDTSAANVKLYGLTFETVCRGVTEK